MQEKPAPLFVENLNTGTMLTADNNNHLKDIFGLAAVEPPREQDTVFGRGGFANRHPGNKEYLRLIEQYEESYMLCQRKYQKVMAVNILHYLRIKGVRFLKKDEKSGVWCTVNLSQCRQKISQRLRERAPFMKLAKFQKAKTHTRKVSMDSTGAVSTAETATTRNKQPEVPSSYSLRDIATSSASSCSISSSNSAQTLDDIDVKERQVEEAVPTPFSSKGHPQPSSVLSQFSFSLQDCFSGSLQVPAGTSSTTAAAGNEEKKTSLALPFDKVFDTPFCPVESNTETSSSTTTKKRHVECTGVLSEANDINHNICQLCPCKRRKVEVEEAAFTLAKQDDDVLSCISLEGLAELDDIFDQESSFNLVDSLPLTF